MQLIQRFTGVAHAHALHPASAMLFFHCFLLPTLETVMRTAYPSDDTSKSWNSAVMARFLECCHVANGDPPQYAAVCAITGLRLPATLDLAITLSEEFIRVNGPDGSDDTAAARRWRLSPASVQKECPTRVHVTSAFRKLGWKCVQRADTSSSSSRPIRIMFNEGERKRVNSPVVVVDNKSWTLRTDATEPWGESHPHQTLTVFTDGSASTTPGDKDTAWAVLFGNDWLRAQVHNDSRLASVPESDLSHFDIKGASHIGGRITPEHGGGVYMAELRAILEALYAVPFSWTLTLISDSLAAIRAIDSYRKEPSARVRLRTEARPLLRLIDSVICERERVRNAALSDGKRSHVDQSALRTPAVSFHHVKAHTGDSDLFSLGNKCVDFIAKQWRTSKTSCPQLDLASAEPWMSVHQEMGGGGEVKHWRLIAGDVRRAVWTRAHDQNVMEWRMSNSQRRFAAYVRGARELWKCALGSELAPNTATPVDTFGLILRVLTDSLQHHDTGTRGKMWICTEEECNKQPFDAEHLMTCASDAARDRKVQAADELRTVLHSAGARIADSGSPHSYFPWFLILCGGGDPRRDADLRREHANHQLVAAFGAFTSQHVSEWLKRHQLPPGCGTQPLTVEERSRLVARVCMGVRTVCLRVLRDLWWRSRKNRVLANRPKRPRALGGGLHAGEPSVVTRSRAGAGRSVLSLSLDVVQEEIGEESDDDSSVDVSGDEEWLGDR